ncbi:MAG TPA: hypothetical protein VEH57_07115 [Thermoplasmata archaeon]|nr:hypothetical protein [Thermoplasmata archaeon]
MGIEALSFLIGAWRDESRSGEPGTATAGGETWRLALDGQILVREGWCEFPAAGDRPAFRHEDLLIVFVDADSEVRGIFWDSDGHLIRYQEVHPDPDGLGVGLVSDRSSPGPRQWLQYRFEEPDHLTGVFSIHAPGAPGFAPYLTWRSVRAPPPGR